MTPLPGTSAPARRTSLDARGPPLSDCGDAGSWLFLGWDPAAWICILGSPRKDSQAPGEGTVTARHRMPHPPLGRRHPWVVTLLSEGTRELAITVSGRGALPNGASGPAFPR